MRELINSLLHLVRLGFGHTENTEITENGDWVAVKNLAEKQGLSAIVLDGIDKANNKLTNRPPKAMMLEWIGEVIQIYEARYKQYEKAIGELAGFYAQHDIKMMVLKGYTCSLDWPKPAHRSCGDIDIWLFGKQKEADKILGEWFLIHDSGLKIDTSHHHHTVFNWKGFTVENHYDFVNVHAHKSSAELEKIFKELGQDDSHFVGITDALTGLITKVYQPSPNLHALFLIKHMVSHFASAEISLRQVLDWGFFVEKHHEEVDWSWLLGLLEKYHMKEFFKIINAICIDNLDFSASIFPTVQFLPEIKDRVLVDIINPAYGAAEPVSLFPRQLYRLKRWHGNAWKQKLCYNESRRSMFWNGLLAKMLKPSSI